MVLTWLRPVDEVTFNVAVCPADKIKGWLKEKVPTGLRGFPVESAPLGLDRLKVPTVPRPMKPIS